eukprot:TRINITY_DN2545_c0_g1_i2.p3 TRINITY_DN2545_c0_g1~~TRINITY_DN2545_c0_g1_i2.p3  ORF type:complete len:202 (-),score=17.76 TRINITY_DN2545_c0_g1_i2:336-941(-)
MINYVGIIYIVYIRRQSQKEFKLIKMKKSLGPRSRSLPSASSMELISQKSNKLDSNIDKQIRPYYMQSVPVMIKMLKKATANPARIPKDLELFVSQNYENQENQSPLSNTLPTTPEIRKQQKVHEKEIRIKEILSLLSNMLSDPLVLKELKAQGGVQAVDKIASQTSGELKTLANNIISQVNARSSTQNRSVKLAQQNGPK